MQTGLRVTVASNPTTQFTEALAAGGATAIYPIRLPASQWRRVLLHSIAVLSLDNCAWEINFFRTTAGLTASPATDTWIGAWRFLETSARQIPGSAIWRYYIGGNDEALVDLTNVNAAASVPYGQSAPAAPWNIYALIVNRSAVNTKAADAAGLLRLDLTIEAMQENA